MISRVVLLPLLIAAPAFAATVDDVQNLAPGVFFHQGDHSRVHCNTTWIELEDYVIIVDATYPAGAQIVIPKIRATTSKPVRFVVDTHHHADHSFGNRLWAELGATIVAQETVLDDVRAKGPERWAAEAKSRPDVAASTLEPPSVTYRVQLAFDDGQRRVELLHFGAAHTRGDTLVWLPNEKILVTGDVCVNGAHNFLGDGNLASWIGFLEKAKQLGATTVCPGHGPVGGAEIITDQQRYLAELLNDVPALVDAKRSPEEIKAAVPAIGARLRAIESIERYVPDDPWLAAHVSDVCRQLGAAPLPR